ncbi:MAG: 5-formyltetrahydrofolate cyclo-ligase, partial [Burkholderiales bacterium]
RLGYGGGYYDRLLAEDGVVALRVLAAFSMQTVARVPTGPWDLPVDVVVTETSVIRIAS